MSVNSPDDDSLGRELFIGSQEHGSKWASSSGTDVFYISHLSQS